MAQLPDDCDPTHAPVADCPESIEVSVDATLCQWSVPYWHLDKMGFDADGDEVICRSSRAFGDGLRAVNIGVECTDRCGNPAANTCRTWVVPQDTTPPWITVRDNEHLIEIEEGAESIWRNLAELVSIDYDDNCTSDHSIVTAITEVKTSSEDEVIEGEAGNFEGIQTIVQNGEEDGVSVFFAD